MMLNWEWWRYQEWWFKCNMEGDLGKPKWKMKKNIGIKNDDSTAIWRVIWGNQSAYQTKCEMKEGWMKNDKALIKNDEEGKMNDEG